MLRIDPTQRHRLEEIRDNPQARITETERGDWTGETKGLRVSLDAATSKLAQADATAARRTEAVSLGIPAYRDIAAATLSAGDRHETAMTTDDLTAALRACAAGLYPLEAGVALLTSNGTFLHRDDFTSRFISHETSGGTPMTAIDWQAAITALASGDLAARHSPSTSTTPSPASTTATPPGSSSRSSTHQESVREHRIQVSSLSSEAPLTIYHSSANSKATALSQPTNGADNGPRESPLTTLAPSEVEVARDREKTAGRISDMNPFGPPGSNGSNCSNAASSFPSSQSEFANMATHPADATTRTSEAPDNRASPATSVAASIGW